MISGTFSGYFSVIALFLFLLSAGIYDLRHGIISLRSSFVFLVAGIIFRIISGTGQQIIPALIPGIIMCIISVITGNSLGAGDGITVLIMAFFADIGLIFLTLVFSFAEASAAALIILIRSKGGKDSFAFIPFIFTGYLTALIFQTL